MSRKFKRCLITGITGSGGSYLAEHILKKNRNINLDSLSAGAVLYTVGATMAPTQGFTA